MGKGYWHGLIAVSASALLAGCGWFGGSAAPVGKARPGADRLIAPTATLPAPPSHRVEQGVTPVDETRGQLGSIVSSTGGQRAQREAIEKATAERDAKAREDRAKRQADGAATPRGEAPPAGAQPAPKTAPASGRRSFHLRMCHRRSYQRPSASNDRSLVTQPSCASREVGQRYAA